jgi:hypothetical protein
MITDTLRTLYFARLSDPSQEFIAAEHAWNFPAWAALS